MIKGVQETSGTSTPDPADAELHRARRVRTAEPATTRKRMTGLERRQQLIDVARGLFAVKGFEAVSIEEVAAKAGVSKPVVYEHFGGVELDGREYGVKEALFAVVIDREITRLIATIEGALGGDKPRAMVERAALGLFTYIEDHTDGFRVLVRDSPLGVGSGSYSNVLGEIAARVQHLLAREFKRRGFDAKLAPMYAQMLVGMVAFTGQWWLDVRKPKKEEVAAHLVNLAWNGLSSLEHKPRNRHT
jgi:AcrR family transcriptional regulator